MFPTALASGLLLAVSSVVQKVMNDLDADVFKRVLFLLEYHAMRSPFALAVSLATSIAAVPYWWIYRLQNVWFSLGLFIWFVASTLSKILTLPIYNAVKALPSTDTEALVRERQKLEPANNLRAWLTFAAVVLMAFGIVKKSQPA